MRQKIIPTIFLVISILWLNGCGQADLQNDRGVNSTSNPVLLVSIDGLMNEYLERNETPNFDRLLAEAVYPEYLIPVFPTNTFPTHWSIVTGLYVENHGIIANSFYDHELEANFSYGPQDSPNDERWWGGEPIWITAEKQGKTAATFFWPGSEASIGGVQSTKWIDYDGSIPDLVRIDSVMTWMDPQGDVRADFGTLYFSFVDSRGHRYGPVSPEVDEAVQEMDSILGTLLDKIEETGLSETMNIILVSDHGMASTNEERVIFIEDTIDLNRVDMLSWSPVALIKPEESEADDIYTALKSAENHYRVFRRDELPERFRFSNHYRIPEIIMIADVGYTITNRPFFESRGVVAGTHGYDNLAPEMRTFFAAKGPDFRTGVRTEAVESIHIYELLSHLLGIEPADNDGDLDQIRFLLNQ